MKRLSEEARHQRLNRMDEEDYAIAHAIVLGYVLPAMSKLQLVGALRHMNVNVTAVESSDGPDASRQLRDAIAVLEQQTTTLELLP